LQAAVPRGVEPPTFGLGNRFAHQPFNDLRPDVANVLHPFLRREIPQHIFARADDLPARFPPLTDKMLRHSDCPAAISRHSQNNRRKKERTPCSGLSEIQSDVLISALR